jgi:hypothetical protein
MGYVTNSWKYSRPRRVNWAAIGTTLLTVVIIGLIVDYCRGTTRYWECFVTAHEYKAAWTEYTTRTDSNGNTVEDSDYHPEEYHVFCEEYGGEHHVFDVQTIATTYHSTKDSQDVTVKTREGRWTGTQWLPSIVK